MRRSVIFTLIASILGAAWMTSCVDKNESADRSQRSGLISAGTDPVVHLSDFNVLIVRELVDFFYSLASQNVVERMLWYAGKASRTVALQIRPDRTVLKNGTCEFMGEGGNAFLTGYTAAIAPHHTDWQDSVHTAYRLDFPTLSSAWTTPGSAVVSIGLVCLAARTQLDPADNPDDIDLYNLVTLPGYVGQDESCLDITVDCANGSNIDINNYAECLTVSVDATVGSSGGPLFFPSRSALSTGSGTVWGILHGGRPGAGEWGSFGSADVPEFPVSGQSVIATKFTQSMVDDSQLPDNRGDAPATGTSPTDTETRPNFADLIDVGDCAGEGCHDDGCAGICDEGETSRVDELSCSALYEDYGWDFPGLGIVTGGPRNEPYGGAPDTFF